jgi:hypothetical protein
MTFLSFDQFADTVETCFPGIKFDGRFRVISCLGDDEKPIGFSVSRADGFLCQYETDQGWTLSLADDCRVMCGFDSLDEAVSACQALA